MEFRVWIEIEMGKQSWGEIEISPTKLCAVRVGFDPLAWLSISPCDEEKNCSRRTREKSDVSIYGERQTLLRFCISWISFIIFFLPPNHLRHLIFGARPMISWDDGGDVCVRANQHTKSAHRDRAITSFWSKGTCKTQKIPSLNRDSFGERKKSSRLQTRGTDPNVCWWKFLIWYVNSLEKMWRPGAEAQPRALWLNLCSEYVGRFIVCPWRKKNLFLRRSSSLMEEMWQSSSF